MSSKLSFIGESILLALLFWVGEFVFNMPNQLSKNNPLVFCIILSKIYESFHLVGYYLLKVNNKSGGIKWTFTLSKQL